MSARPYLDFYDAVANVASEESLAAGCSPKSAYASAAPAPCMRELLLRLAGEDADLKPEEIEWIVQFAESHPNQSPETRAADYNRFAAPVLAQSRMENYDAATAKINARRQLYFSDWDLCTNHPDCPNKWRNRRPKSVRHAQPAVGSASLRGGAGPGGDKRGLKAIFPRLFARA